MIEPKPPFEVALDDKGQPYIYDTDRHYTPGELCRLLNEMVPLANVGKLTVKATYFSRFLGTSEFQQIRTAKIEATNAINQMADEWRSAALASAKKEA